MRSSAHLPVLAAALVACGAPAPSTSSPDAASSDRDGAVAPDAQAAIDAAPADARPRDAAPAADAGPDAPLPIVRGHAGGASVAVALAGGRAYVGVGPRLTVWALTDGGPIALGETAPLTGIVSAIAVRGAYAFVTTATDDDGALHVVDVADPAAPVVLAALRLGTGAFSRPVDVAVEGTTVYVADRDQGVFAVDVSAPPAPVVVAFRPVANALAVEPVGERVHVFGWHPLGRGVEALAADDLAPLGAVIIRDVVDAALTSTGLLVSRGHQGLAVDDLADAAAPVRLFEAPVVSAWTLIPAGDGAWVTVDGHLRYLDASDRGAVALGAAFPPTAWAISAGGFADGRLALVDHQGNLSAYAVAPRSGPSLLGRAVTGPCTTCVATAGAGAVLAVAETTPGAAGTLATAGRGDLARIGGHLTLNAEFADVAVAGDHAYVADWFGSLRELDLSNPAAPVPRARVDTAGHPGAVAATGDRVYLGESIGGGALRVFARHATGPVEVGAIATGRVADLAVAGGLVYVAEAAPALRIYDASVPSAIALVGAYLGCAAPSGIAVAGAIAVLGCGDGFHVVDVGDPSAPVARAVWRRPGTVRGGVVALDGRWAYYGHGAGVSVVDLVDPHLPTQVADLRTAGTVGHLTVPAPGRVVASAGRAGLYQWDAPSP